MSAKSPMGEPFNVLNEVSKKGAHGQLGETCFAYVYCAHHEEERKRSRNFCEILVTLKRTALLTL